jgi:hypothetical protein
MRRISRDDFSQDIFKSSPFDDTSASLFYLLTKLRLSNIFHRKHNSIDFRCSKSDISIFVSLVCDFVIIPRDNQLWCCRSRRRCSSTKRSSSTCRTTATKPVHVPSQQRPHSRTRSIPMASSSNSVSRASSPCRRRLTTSKTKSRHSKNSWPAAKAHRRVKSKSKSSFCRSHLPVTHSKDTALTSHVSLSTRSTHNWPAARRMALSNCGTSKTESTNALSKDTQVAHRLLRFRRMCLLRPRWQVSRVEFLRPDSQTVGVRRVSMRENLLWPQPLSFLGHLCVRRRVCTELLA